MMLIWNCCVIEAKVILALLLWAGIMLPAEGNVPTPRLVVTGSQNMDLVTQITLRWQEEIEDDGVSAVLVGESPTRDDCIPNTQVSGEGALEDGQYTFPPFPAGSLVQNHSFCVRFQNSGECVSDTVTAQAEFVITIPTTATEGNTPSTSSITPTTMDIAETSPTSTNIAEPAPSTTDIVDNTLSTTDTTAFTTNNNIVAPITATTDNLASSADITSSNTVTEDSTSRAAIVTDGIIDGNGFPELVVIAIGVASALILITLVIIILALLVYIYCTAKSSRKESNKNKTVKSKMVTNQHYEQTLSSELASEYALVMNERHSSLRTPVQGGYSDLQHPDFHGNLNDAPYSRVQDPPSDGKYNKLNRAGTLGNKDTLDVNAPPTRYSQPHIQGVNKYSELQHLNTHRNKNTHVYTYIDVGNEHDHLSPSSSPPTSSSNYSEPSNITDRTD